jgi:hypothetical protein
MKSSIQVFFLAVIVVLSGFTLSKQWSNSNVVTEIKSASNNDPNLVISLTITRNSNGDISIDKSTEQNSENVGLKAFVLEDFHYPVMSMPNDSVFVEYDPLPIGYNVFWISIDCDTLPMTQVGIGYAFWCDGCSGCKPSVVSTINSNSATVTCNNSCCTLKKKEVGGLPLADGAGFLLVAKSVTYNF